MFRTLLVIGLHLSAALTCDAATLYLSGRIENDVYYSGDVVINGTVTLPNSISITAAQGRIFVNSPINGAGGNGADGVAAGSSGYAGTNGRTLTLVATGSSIVTGSIYVNADIDLHGGTGGHGQQGASPDYNTYVETCSKTPSVTNGGDGGNGGTGGNLVVSAESLVELNAYIALGGGRGGNGGASGNPLDELTLPPPSGPNGGDTGAGGDGGDLSIYAGDSVFVSNIIVTDGGDNTGISAGAALTAAGYDTGVGGNANSPMQNGIS